MYTGHRTESKCSVGISEKSASYLLAFEITAQTAFVGWITHNDPSPIGGSTEHYGVLLVYPIARHTSNQSRQSRILNVAL